MFWQHRLKNLSKLIYRKAGWLVRCILHSTSHSNDTTVTIESNKQELLHAVHLHLLELNSLQARYKKQGYRIKIE